MNTWCRTATDQLNYKRYKNGAIAKIVPLDEHFLLRE
jgi:hypothetical protein